MMLRICDKRTGQQLACFGLPSDVTVVRLQRIRDNVIKRFGRTVSVKVVL